MSNKLFSCKKCGRLIDAGSDYYGCESEPYCLDCSPPRIEKISRSSPGEIKISFGDTKMCIITEDEPAEDCNHVVQTDPTGVGHINQTGFLEVFFDYIFEVTYSCTLEFPNGDVVEIPPPEGEGWESKRVMTKSPDYWGPRVNSANSSYQGCVCIWDENEFNYDIAHDVGFLIAREYMDRIDEQRPNITNIIEWTRETKIAADSEKEAPEWKTKYPLLNGVE